VKTDSRGNIFVADVYNNVVRKINAAGIITTIAGTGTAGYNGDNIPATAAQLKYPNAAVADKSGNIYIADAGNNRARKIPVKSAVSVADMRSHNDSKVVLLPNPSNGHFTVITPAGSTTCTVSDITGKVIYKKVAITSLQTDIHIDATPGIYLLHVSTLTGISTEKVIIQ
jgi:hypothetical protein